MILIKFVLSMLQSVVTMGVLALSVDFYNPAVFAYEIPQILETLVVAGVVGVSLFWAILHVVVAGLLGLAANGVVDGIRMGLLLGVGLGISRLWPHCLAWGAGSVIAEGPLWHAIGLGVIALVLLVLNSAMRYFWSTVQGGIFGGSH
ncbi:MAG: hypothetical protein OXR68_04640 [Alphaproteobacteria bacterium]|nr:hypothetical protein [Alphaproteobacteria bacterium]MDD9919896.1 hypothetical protein [Alphaproteobacteria bacterium]